MSNLSKSMLNIPQTSYYIYNSSEKVCPLTTLATFGGYNMKLKLCALVSGILLFVNLPAAHGQIYRVSLLGESEIPAVNTPGFGRGIITLNRNTHEMRVSANFTGLRGTTTASHIHCCTVQPSNAGVATTVPTFLGFPLGVTSGSWDRIYDMTQSSTW